MDFFELKNGQLYAEDCSVESLVREYGSPLYIYSEQTLKRHCERLKAVFQDVDMLPCYAVKANSNLSVLKVIGDMGFGADVVSVGEMERAIYAGISAERIVFSGVGKRRDELLRGAELGIKAFNVESEFEWNNLQSVSKQLGKSINVALRVNPHIDAKTHPKITTGLYDTKFGLSEDAVGRLLTRAVNEMDSGVKLVGLSCHIGSQMTSADPLHDASRRMAEVITHAESLGLTLEFIDMGGGLGIRYDQEKPPSLEDYAKSITSGLGRSDLQLVLEPGRVIAGNAGIFVSSVIGIKTTPQKNFAVIDGAMNDLMRPALYGAYHTVVRANERTSEKPQIYDIVGPICESTDVLATDRELDLEYGDLIAFRSTGAYCASMASQYNSRPRVAEVMVNGSSTRLVRRRETLDDLFECEKNLD